MILNQTTLGELYQSLNQEEVKGLELYLQKNTVGKNNILYQLHKLMVQAKLEATMAKLDTDYIKAELFGGDAKSISKLTTYNNLLINHIKDYLILSKVREKNIYTETLWGEILIERRLKRNLLLKVTNYKYNLYKDSYAIFKNFLYKREVFFLQFIKLSRSSYSDFINALFENLREFNNYQTFYRLELYSGLISYLKVQNRVNEINLSEIKPLIENGKISKNDLIRIQALICELSLDEDEETYNLIISSIKDKISLMSNEMLIQLIPVIINHCLSRLVIKGEEKYELSNYNFLNLLYQENKLLVPGIFSVIRMFTYIRLELRYGTIEKAEQLLEESLKVIAPAQKDSFQYLIESRIIFAKKDYKLSLRKISTINPSDSIYYFPQYKIMLIKNYIMLADIDRLMAERENFYKYLNNQKNIQEDEKRRHKLFIKYTEYLTNARYEYLTDYMKKRIENALLQTSPYFSEKQWVRERWEELRILNS